MCLGGNLCEEKPPGDKDKDEKRKLCWDSVSKRNALHFDMEMARGHDLYTGGFIGLYDPQRVLKIQPNLYLLLKQSPSR